MKTSSPGREGFSLIELVLVCTLLAVIFTIAVPGIVEAKKHANESVAISSLRSLATAQTQYRMRHGSYGDLATLTSSGSVDDSLSDGQKNGYIFASLSATTDSWGIGASPSSSVFSGNRYFYIDETQVIRFREGGAASSSDSAVD